MNKSQKKGVRLRHPVTSIFFASLFLAVSAGFSPVLCSQKTTASSACEGLETVKQELELTRESLKHYKELYERKDKEINALNNKLNTLQDGFDKFDELTQRLTKEKDALESQQAQLAAQLKQLETQKRAFEKQNKLLTDCTKESQQKSLDIAALTSMSKAEQQNLMQKLKEAQGQIDSAVQNNKDLTRKNTDLQERYSELSIRISGLEKNNALLSQQKESAANKAQDLEKEIEIVKAKLLTAQAENSKLKEKSSRSADCEGTVRQLETNRGELTKLKDELTKVKEENKQLSSSVSKLKDMDDLEQEAALLRNEVTALAKENKKQQSALVKCKANETLPGELEKARNKLSDLEKSKDALVKEYTEKMGEQKKLLEEVLDLRMRVGQQQSQLEQLEGENKKLKAAPVIEKQESMVDLGRLNKELTRLQEENDRLRKAQPVVTGEQSVLAEEVRQIREELARTEAENKKLRGATIAIPAHNKALQDEIKSLKAEIADLKDENTKLRQNPVAKRQEGYDQGLAAGLQRELEKTRKEFVALQVQCERLEKENIQLKQAAAQLQDQEALNKDIVRLREKLSLAEQERNMLRSEIADARKQDGFVEGLKQSYEKEVEKLQGDLETAKADNKKLAEETARLKKFEASTQDMAEARRQIIKISEEKQAVVAELEAMKIKQDNIVDQLVKVRKEKESIEESSRGKTGSQIERLQKDLKDAQQFSYQLVQEKAGYQVREKQLMNQIAMLESQLSQVEKTVAELNSKHEILTTEHSKLSEQLAQTMVKAAESERDKQALAAQAESSTREITSLRAELVKAQDIISKMKDEMYQLRKANEELTDSNSKIVGQRAQETALATAQIEQLRAHKDGEIAALNQRFAQFKSEKEAEVLTISEKINKLQQELQSAQAISLQLMQEKTGFAGQQKTLTDEYKKMQNQNIVMAGEIKKLEDQNAFLKNQFISISQEAGELKRMAKGAKGSLPQERYIEELQRLKAELLRKSQQVRLYEQAGGPGLSAQNKQLVDDYTRLKKQFEMLKAKNKELEEVKKQYESFKARAGKLPEENATLHYNLSVLYAQNREYQKAVAELEKVIELKPTDSEAYYNLGVILGEYLNDRKRAIGYFRKYLELAPKDPDADRIRKYVLTYETYGQE